MTTLVGSVVFGSIGAGYFIYGKKQKRPVPLFVGMALIVFPYVTPNPYAMGILGALLTLLPWLIRRFA